MTAQTRRCCVSGSPPPSAMAARGECPCVCGAWSCTITCMHQHAFSSYTCAEQWMMAEKARLFGDEEARELVFQASTPKEMKGGTSWCFAIVF
jgi:hypothetical protein